MTKFLAGLGLAVMAASIASAAFAVPAVQSGHPRAPAPRHGFSHGRRHSPIVHGVRRLDPQSGMLVGRRIHKPITLQ